MTNRRKQHQMTEADRYALSVLERFLLENGCTPTRRELADAMGVMSTNTVQHRLIRLEMFGEVEFRGGNSTPVPIKLHERIKSALSLQVG